MFSQLQVPFFAAPRSWKAIPDFHYVFCLLQTQTRGSELLAMFRLVGFRESSNFQDPIKEDIWEQRGWIHW